MARLTSAVAATTSPVRQVVGSRQVMNGNTATAGLQSNSRIAMIAPDDISDLSLLLQHQGGETDPTNAVRQKWAIEDPAGNVWPVFIAGKRLNVVDASGFIETTVAPVEIVKGATYYLRGLEQPSNAANGTVSTTSGSAVVTGTSTTFASSVLPGSSITPSGGAAATVLSVESDTSLTLTANYGTTLAGVAYTAKGQVEMNYPTGTLDTVAFGSAVSDLVDSGTISGAGTAPGPAAVIAQRSSGGVVLGKQKVIMLAGDSWVVGQGDTNAVPVQGYVNRAIFGGTTYTTPLAIPLNVAKGGEQGSTYATKAGSFRRKQLLRFASSVYCGYGINDVSGSGGSTQTLAQLQATVLTIATYSYRRGLPHFQATVPPQTSSTDSWATSTNQTAYSGTAAKETVRQGINAWLRAGAPIDSSTKAAVAIGTGGALLAGQTGHPLTGYVEIAYAVESSPDSGKWKNLADNGTGPWTADGVHPLAIGHQGIVDYGTANPSTGFNLARFA